MVLPFFGGMLVDKFGVRSMALALSLLLLAGQIVFAVGCTFENFYLMLAGRMLFGLGGETMWVAQSTFVTLWFDSSELAFAFGINTLFARLGTVLNDKLSPVIADTYSVTTALWVGVAFCVFSLTCTYVLVRVDAAHTSPDPIKGPAAPTPTTSPSTRRPAWLASFSASFWLIAISYVSFYAVIGPFNNVASSVLLERDYFQQPPPLCQRCGIGYYNRSFDCDAVSPHCPNVPPFAWPLPLLSQNCSITSPFDQFQCSKAPPYILDQDINCDDVAWREGPFTHRYCATKSQAAESATQAMSVMPLIVAVVAPLSGSVVDAVGLRPMLALAAEFLLVAAHVALAYTTVSAYKVLAALGVGACLFSSTMWPCIPYVVDPSVVGTAFGAITAFSNCGLAIVPLVVAAVFNAYDAYIPHVEVVFIASAAWTLALGVALNALDMARGHVLNRKVLTEWHGGGTPRYFPPHDQDELDQPLLLDQEII
ncbi:hypothetical protein, variant 1 [Aphanomyces astaci]|nr:hypothetical protein, variant 1 [Aphanomyces astaci]ETV85121.1 hypothetical protein, variant 1 [Aphanomyces astaci]|eukprot:XP_009825139.1 hypothetical protein, variant 1 [Aphanomyces astaci]